MDLYDVIRRTPQFIRNWEVDSQQEISQGNYDLSKILEIIQRQLVGMFGVFKPTNLKFNPNQYRFEFNSTVTFAIACYTEHSIIQLLGFGSQSTILHHPNKRAVEYIVFNANNYLQAKLPPSITRISSMYVYSDIVEQSPVGNSQVPIMGFLPIKSNLQEIGHWVFNPPLYVRVRKKNITSITMKISTETGEDFPIQDGCVTCHLNFRRRPFLA